MSQTILDYTIYITDPALAVQYQQMAGLVHVGAGDTWVEIPGTVFVPASTYKGQVYGCPAAAARKFGTPVLIASAAFSAPCIQDTKIVSLDQQTLPIDQDSFDRGPGGLWGWITSLFGGGQTTFFWRGTFRWAAPAHPIDPTGGTPGDPDKIRERAWIDGFELPDLGEGGTTGGLTSISRGASRHVDGYGFAIRANQVYKKHTVAEFGASARTKSWERFYIRIQRAPTARVGFWRTHNSVSDSAGLQLGINPNLAISLLDTNNVNAIAHIADTDPIDLQTWVRIDIVFEYSATVPTCKLYLNGVLAINATGFDVAFAGLCRAGNHTASSIGFEISNQGDPVANVLSMDVDDWMNATVPVAFNGLDWVNGSRMVRINPTGFNAENEFATGNWRNLLCDPAKNTFVHVETSGAAGAILAVDTDSKVTVDKRPSISGLVALIVGLFNNRGASAGDGELGYSLAGAAPVMASIAQSATVKWNTVMYRPTGMATPVPVTPLELRHTRNANTDTCKAFMFAAVGETLGIFGAEDVVVAIDGTSPQAPPRGNGVHNAPWWTSEWAYADEMPVSPLVFVGGTYVGDDIGQELTFKVPVHFLIVRHVASGNLGTIWFPSMLAAKKHFEEGHTPPGMVQGLMNVDYVPTGTGNGELTANQQQQALIRIAGNDTHVNASGETYQYIAVCDPGMRFLEAIAMSNYRGIFTITTKFQNELFTALALFIAKEKLDGTTTNGIYFKGVGHAMFKSSPLDAAEIDSTITIQPGSVTLQSTELKYGSTSGTDVVALGFRKDDGSADPGLPNTFWIGTYTGDGSGNRTITCEALSTVYPLFALVTPHNAASVYRDPSHTTTTSTTVPASASPSNGIRGGDLGKILVGSDLNANGIVYSYFVIGGGTVACNNGFSCNGEFIPVIPIPPPQRKKKGGDPPPPPPGGGGGDGGTDPPPDPFGTTCAPKSQKLLNIALQRIGISRQIANVNTENTTEVAQGRLVFQEACEKVLRDFAWPSATRYVAMTLLAGDGITPTLRDWLYSYRVPSNCVFARRLVKARGAAVDPTPPAFELSSDETGDILYTNEASAVLEYTRSPGCAANLQDPLFREALICQLAYQIAPALTRVEGVADRMEKAYQQAIALAASTIRPGIPGAPVAIVGGDDAGCTSYNLDVANLALLQIGANTITSLSPGDQSREAASVRLIFEQELRSTLRDFPWPFAKKYADSSVGVELPIVAGSTTVKANPDWQYSYRLPADCLFVRRIVTDKGKQFDPNPPRYEIAEDATGGLLLTDQADAVIEYTARQLCTLKKADPLFREAFAWRLSAKLAPSLATKDPLTAEQLGRGPQLPPESSPKERGAVRQQLAQRTAAQAWAMYQDCLVKARVAALNEQQQAPNGEASWITDRA